ncbi:MAG: inorganic phosphate transporter [Veillonellaceae bacterium]|nr:inorganic phosphate transporter [Veillonellaceae bacterium]
MPELSTEVFLVIFLALAFDYINGFHDTANAIATSVSTRALSPKQAIWMAAALNFAGALFSTGVAKTIGGDIVKSASLIDQRVITAALIGAIVWNLLTWWYGIPSSSSHALVGGIIGAVVAGRGWDPLNLAGIEKIFLSLVLSPIVALIVGYFFLILMMWLFRGFPPHALSVGFARAQIGTAALIAFSHGSNDAQKAMGIITLALLSAGSIPSLDVPTWVKVACALSMSLGTAIGGWKIIKTMGTGIARLEPFSGCAVEITSSLVIFSATLLHLPVSTTHVVSGSIMGIGASNRIRSVRWGVARQMLMAWVLTIPLSALASGLIYYVSQKLF